MVPQRRKSHGLEHGVGVGVGGPCIQAQVRAAFPPRKILCRFHQSTPNALPLTILLDRNVFHMQLGELLAVGCRPPCLLPCEKIS